MGGPSYTLTSWLALACWQHLWSTQLRSQPTTRTLQSTPASTPSSYNFLRLHSFKQCLTGHLYSIFLSVLHTSLQGLQPLSAHQEWSGLKTTSGIEEQSLQSQVQRSCLRHDEWYKPKSDLPDEPRPHWGRINHGEYLPAVRYICWVLQRKIPQSKPQAGTRQPSCAGNQSALTHLHQILPS